MVWHLLHGKHGTATNSYTEYCALFGKRPFPAQVGGLAAWIGHLGGRRLKPKTIKGYLAGLRSLRLNCTLDTAELEVYSHPILQRIIAGLQRLYGEGDTRERRPITRDILLKLISRFDQRTFEGANLHAAFCLAFAGFLRMGEFTYDKVKHDFSSGIQLESKYPFKKIDYFLFSPPLRLTHSVEE